MSRSNPYCETPGCTRKSGDHQKCKECRGRLCDECGAPSLDRRLCDKCRGETGICATPGCGRRSYNCKTCNACRGYVKPQKICATDGCGKPSREYTCCHWCRNREKQCANDGCTNVSGVIRICGECRSTRKSGPICETEGCSNPAPKMRKCRHCRNKPCETAGCTRKTYGNRLCAKCSGHEDKTCETCGARSGASRLCPKCAYINKHGEQAWRVYVATRTKLRSDLKRSATVAEPVPPSFYAKVRSGPCVYCGAPGEHVDHVIPLSRGGIEHPSNLVSACGPCNHSKRSRLLWQWTPSKVAHAVESSPEVRAIWLADGSTLQSQLIAKQLSAA